MKESGNGCLGLVLGLAFLLFCFMACDALKSCKGRSLIEDARKENSIELYKMYASEYRGGEYIGEADDAIYSICSKNGDFSDYKETFPNGKHINDIIYTECERINVFDVDSTGEYLIQHVFSEYKCANLQACNDTLKSALAHRLRGLLHSKLQNAYYDMIKSGSLKEYVDFKKNITLDMLQEIDFYEEAEKLDEKIWTTESKSWKLATLLNTQDAYEKYLKKYPNGEHGKQAIDNQVACVMGAEHGSIPQMERKYYTGKSYSTIEVSNDTQYTLTLLYSGKESKRLVISAFGTKNVTLINGYYKIAASVNASDVRPFAGTETLNGSEYSVNYYIQTTRY